MHNELCERLGIEFPIFAFSHCRDVVAAVTNAGGIGVLGALAFSPEQLELELKWIDEHVNGKLVRRRRRDPRVARRFRLRGRGCAARRSSRRACREETTEWIDSVLDELGVPPLPEDADVADAANADEGRRARRLGAARLDERDVEAAGRGRARARHQAARQRARPAAQGRRRRRARPRRDGRRARRSARPGPQAGRARRRHRDRAGHRGRRPHR